MTSNVIFIAINSGGVAIDKEAAMEVDETQFATKFAAFKKKHYGYSCTFFTEVELRELLKRFERKPWNT